MVKVSLFTNTAQTIHTSARGAENLVRVQRPRWQTGHLRTSRIGRRPTCPRAHGDGTDRSYVAPIHGGGIARWHILISKRTAGGAPRSHLDAFLSARSNGPAHSPPHHCSPSRASNLSRAPTLGKIFPPFRSCSCIMRRC